MNESKSSNFSLALLIFIAVFGVSNIANNYAVLGGEAFFWFLALILYFIPMSLIMAELASANTNTASGISSWVEIGTTRNIAFFCAWAYFIENIFYLPMLASRVPVFLSWLFGHYDSLNEVVNNPDQIQGLVSASSNQILFLVLAFIVLILIVVMAYYFENIFDFLGKYIGAISLVIAFGFIFMTFYSVIVLSNQPAYQLTLDNTLPQIGGPFLLSPVTITSLVWIIFSIGGIETIGSVVNKIDNPKKRIPKVVIIGAILVVLAYAIGVLGISFILTPGQLSPEALENVIPVMFAQASIAMGWTGQGGIIFLKLVMLAQVIITIGAGVLWFAATINVLFLETGEGILPPALEKKDKHEKPLNAFIFTTVLVLLFLIISGSSVVSNIYYTLYDMSTDAMVIPFILLLFSFLIFKYRDMEAPYKFLKNRYLSLIIGIILTIITVLAFVFGVADVTLLNNGIQGDFTDSFILYFGGITFFLLIGLAVFLRKNHPFYSDWVLVLLFLLAGFFFTSILYLGSLVFLGMILVRMYRKSKNKKEAK